MVPLTTLTRPLVIALSLLTTLPVRYPVAATGIERRRSLYLYPLVGLVIGCFLWFAGWLLPGGDLLPAMLVLALWVGLTGGLHLDGLADSTDAWVGGHGNRRRTLAILRDPAAGPMAVVMILLVLGLKFVSLATLFGHGMPAMLLVVPMTGRAAVVVLYATTPYVRRGGLGESLRPVHRDRHWMMVCLAGCLLVLLLLPGVMALPVLLPAMVAFSLVRRAALTRLHGFTGDVAGAMVEIVETVLLIALVIMVSD